jgi:hypothetical protein
MLLKTAIAMCGVAVIMLLALGICDSWTGMQAASRAVAAAVAADASADWKEF